VIYKLYKTFKVRERAKAHFIAQLLRERERERKRTVEFPMTAGIDF
jgi:hypothetical protein